MSGQYFQLPNQIYTSMDVGSLAPMIAKVGEATQGRANAVANAEDQSDEILAHIKAAPTDQQHKQEVVNEYKQELEKASQKAYEDPTQGIREFRKWQTKLNTDPRINALQHGYETYTKFAEPIEGDPNKYDPQVDPNRDIKDSSYIQRSGADILKNPTYRLAPTKFDFNANIDKAADHLKPVITDVLNKQGVSVQEGAEPIYDAGSDKWYIQTTTGKTQEISGDTVDKAAEGFAKTFLSGPESEYYKAHLERTIGHDPNDLDFTKNYIKDRWSNRFYKQTDTTTNLKQVSEPRVAGNGKKKGNGTSDDRDNVFKTKLDEIATSKPVKQSDGTTKVQEGTTTVNDKEMGAFLGGDVQGNHINANLTGRKVFLTSPDQANETMETRNAITYNDQYNELKRSLEEKVGKENNRISSTKVGDLDKDSTSKLKSLEDAPTSLLHTSQDEMIKESNKKSKFVHDYNTKLIDDFKSKNPKYANSDLRVDIDDKGNHFIAEDKYSKKVEVDKDPELISIKAKALADGIDLNDSKLQDKIKNLKNSDPALERFNEALQNGELDGEYSLIPHKGSDNIITDKDGNLFGKNDIFMTEDQLNQVMPDPWGPGAGWKDLRDKKILKPGNIKDKEGNVVQGYMLPATIQSTESAASMTRNMQLNTYGHDDKTEVAMPRLIQESNDAIVLHRGKSQLKNIESAINKTPKNQEVVINSIDEAGKQDQSGIIHQSLVEINSIKDKKERNKEYADLYLMINNHDAWLMMHPELQNKQQQSPQDQGGVQEGWTTTPANPLQ